MVDLNLHRRCFMFVCYHYSLAAVLGRAHWSLFALGHYNMDTQGHVLFSAVILFAFYLFKFVFLHQLVGFIQFLHEHYDGLTIYHIPDFRPPRVFFPCVTSDKNFSFWFFSRANVTFFSPVFTMSFETLKFLHYSIERHSVERRVVIVFARERFPARFYQKQIWKFRIFSKQMWRFPLPTGFRSFYALFPQR